ncbi:response regulator [Flavipsychrobacter stenotrophus]|uniref:Response regulator n=1 Tax=Flavipsychrobacter stenotrophus TaxID=2077091 RepID=A0A2S7SS29_9BACT|nr:response regulator [Flavipsychrobacter stenotrophus]PQJ09405.1 response regulator [Flavipsychrobacter stenotrophus]
MLEGKNILIVDDNKLNQKILGFVLEKNGAVIKVADNGLEAVECVLFQRFDAIVMDIQMPELGGLEASRYIKFEMGLNIPIVGLTANNVEDENATWTAAGMDMCVSKPFDPPVLCELIVQLIENNIACQYNTL